jgi:hypothetical protein
MLDPDPQSDPRITNAGPEHLASHEKIYIHTVTKAVGYPDPKI